MVVLIRCLRRRINRSVCRTLLWILAVLAVAAAINGIGIRIVGDVARWNRWLKEHAAWFVAWRLCVYGATTYGWWRLRERLCRREPGPEIASRLRRMEIAAMITVLAVEGAVYLQSFFLDEEIR